jgi:hypothetical protein
VSRHRANEAVVPGGGRVVELEFGHRSDTLIGGSVAEGAVAKNSLEECKDQLL